MKFQNATMSLSLSLILGLGAATPVCYLAVPAPVVSAAVQHVSAEGSYTMGDGFEESQKVAKMRAKDDALRMAAEQAGVYVESYTKTVNSTLTEDEIFTLASTVLSGMNETYTFDDMGGKGIKIICHIEADVDTVKIDEVLKMRREDAQKWAELQGQDKALREQMEKLRKENEELKAAYAKATTEQEKQKVNAAARKNQEAVTAVDWYNRGYDAQSAKPARYQEAVRDYTEAIRLDPKYAPAYNNRGNAYNDLKQYEKAIRDHTEAIRLDPKYAHAYSNRGNVYKALKQYEKAIRDHTEAIRLDPKYALAYYNRGNEYYDLKQYEKAIEDYTEAIRLNPAYADAYSNRGNAYNDLKQYEKAIRDYTEAIRLGATHLSYTYNGRGNVYYKQAKYRKALADHMESVRLEPRARAYYDRGWDYFKLGDYANAYRDAKQANNLQVGKADDLLNALRKHGY